MGGCCALLLLLLLNCAALLAVTPLLFPSPVAKYRGVGWADGNNGTIGLYCVRIPYNTNCMEIPLIKLPLKHHACKEGSVHIHPTEVDSRKWME